MCTNHTGLLDLTTVLMPYTTCIGPVLWGNFPIPWTHDGFHISSWRTAPWSTSHQVGLVGKHTHTHTLSDFT